MPNIIGATIRATNRTHGLAPARAEGADEIVLSVRAYDMSIETDAGNFYFNGDYRIVRYVSGCCGESLSRPFPGRGSWLCDNCGKPQD